MKKVLFVCLGNICRSPMAEFMFKDMVKKRNIDNEFTIESRGTSNEEEGNTIYYLAKEKLEEKGIPYGNRKAKQITREDIELFDYIITMEQKNINNILNMFNLDSCDKLHCLLDFSENKRDISDPWYTRDFEKAYNDVNEGLESFLDYLGY